MFRKTYLFFFTPCTSKLRQISEPKNLNPLKPFVTLLMLTFMCNFSFAQKRIDSTLTYLGSIKDYSIFEPCTYRPSNKTKFMLAFTGMGSSETPSRWRDTLSTFANENNLLLVVPHANSGITDTAFATFLMDSILNWYNVDTSAMYMLGFSWGARLSYMYALNHSDWFDGLLPIASAHNVWDISTGLSQQQKNNSKGMALAIINGSLDNPTMRVTLVKDTFKNYTTFIWDTVLPGVGHTYNFPNRNLHLSNAFAYMDSVNNGSNATVSGTVTVNAGGDRNQCLNDTIHLGDSLNISSSLCARKFTYSWSPSVGLSDTSIANPLASVTSRSTFYLKVGDPYGNFGYDTIVVNPLKLPNVVVSPDDTLCPKQTKGYSVSGTKSFSWSPQAGLSCSNCPNPTINISQSMIYVVTGTDSMGCKAKDTLNIQVYPQPQINAGKDTSICEEDSIQLKASGGQSYRWISQQYLSDSTIHNPMAFPKTTTLFAVYGTDSNGCQGVDGISVRVNKKPLLNGPGDTSICYNESIPLKVTGAPQFVWNNVSGLSCTHCSNPNWQGKKSTNLIVKGISAAGCFVYDTVAITVANEIPLTTSGSDTICENDTSLIWAQGAQSYRWIIGSAITCDTCAQSKVFPVRTSNYTVVATAASGCTDTSTLTVTVHPLPTSAISGDTVHCYGDTNSLSVVSSGNILWVEGAVDDTLSTNPQISPDSSAWFVLIATDQNSCSVQDSFFVNVQRPVAQITSNIQGNTYAFSPSGSQGFDSHSFNFSNAIGTANQDSFTFSQSGSYEICLTVSTDEGCSDVICETFDVVMVSNSEVTTGSDFRIFPNPVKDELFLQSSLAEINRLKIIDHKGSVHLEYEEMIPNVIPVSTLVPGIYFLEVQTATDHMIMKFIKR